MNPNHTQLIENFYTAFAQRDSAAMTACYHPDVTFSDPVFANLKGWRAAAMWRMLCERGKDLRIEFRDVQADATSGGATWEAWYTFSASGKSVHNKVKARFEFADDKILKHTDDFDLTTWMGMALGTPGKLLGWLPPMQNAVRKKALKGLDDYIVKRNLSASDFFPTPNV